MSLAILPYTHVLCRRAHLVKKKHFSRYNLPQIFFMCSKALWSNDTLLCNIEISGKTQNYRLKSVCSFKVTRFYLILLCKQHNWTSGTYSIVIAILLPYSVVWLLRNRFVLFFLLCFILTIARIAKVTVD